MLSKKEPGLTARLADAVVNIHYKDFPPVVVERGKELMLDGLGNMLAGSIQPLGPILIGFVKEVGGSPHSTVIGGAIKSAAPWAALANGTFCRSMDYDPPQPGHHPVGANLPASMALAEKEGLPGWRLMEAFILGLEIQARTQLATDSVPIGPGGRQRSHGRGIAGTLSAAMAAGKLLDLDVWQSRMALGIVSAKAGGIDSAGTMCNPSDSGNAASIGVQAAMLARRGFTGRENAVEEPFGFHQFLGEGADLEAIVKDLGDPLYLADHSISIKKYPCQYPTHRHIDAILAMYREAPWNPEDVEAVEVLVTLMPGDANFNYYSIHNNEPRTGLDGKFSVAYTAAAAALDGTVGIDTFTDEKRFSPGIVDMLQKVSVSVSQERPRTYAEMWSEVTMRFKNKPDHGCRITLPRGIAGGEPLTRDERVAKFVDCACRVVTQSQAMRIVELVERVDQLDNLEELFALLRAEA